MESGLARKKRVDAADIAKRTPVASSGIVQAAGTEPAPCAPMLRLLFAIFLASTAAAENPGSVTLVPLEKLSDRSFTALAQRALGVRAVDWRHAETEHFVLHFFDAGTAAAVSVEARKECRPSVPTLKWLLK